MNSYIRLLGCVSWCCTTALLAAQPPRVIDGKLYHLGTAGDPEWQEFEGKTPHGRRLDLKFDARTNASEQTLFIRQQDVKLEWGVELNGRKLGRLFLMEADLVQSFPLSQGALRDGENTLSIIPPRERDDIVVGDIKLDARPPAQALNEAGFLIQVTDADSQVPIPCRLTITDSQGALVPCFAGTNQSLAVRPGVVYSGNGAARLGLPAGNYMVYATRGFEYSVSTNRVALKPGQKLTLQPQLRREVPTAGWAACDTHVHTFTYSGHGDATIEERMLTLAGEGIELPVATDHNVSIDYSEAARQTGMQSYFTPMIGDEVTTETGHFNVFPFQPGGRGPNHRVSDWTRLVDSFRASPGVRVVILNHPRNIHSNFQPFAAKHFNPVTGENRRGPEFTFDAIEVVNSSALQSDLMLAFRDWFALLNYGYRIFGVGSSDGHDVSRYIVGQGRTYVACQDNNPGALDVGAACDSFRDGRLLVSLGLLTRMTVEEKFGVGDLATGLGELMRVTVTVLGPSWTSADRVELFANGVKIREQKVETPVSPVEKTRITWIIPRPAYDAHLVAIASGPAVTAPYWAIAKPYQPSSRVWEPRVLGATNPIWVDGDGDGKFTAPRIYAKEILQRLGADAGKLMGELARYDEAVAAQAASLCQAAGRDLRSPEFEEALKNTLPHVRRGFAAYAATLADR